MNPSLTRNDIQRGLSELGLTEGDIVLLHSSLSSFGAVDGGAETVVGAFLSVLGESGTLVTPTFGELGIITKIVRRHPRAVRGNHPMASVAAIGADAERICKDHWKAETSHGQDTPYVRIADLGGYVCLAGVDQDRNTTLHTAEVILRLPYLSDRTRTFTTDQGEVTRTFRFFPGPHRDFIGLDRMLRRRGIVRMGRIGNAVIRLMKSRALIDACLEAGGRDPAFVLCDNPNCADCVGQRALIRRDRIAGESFTLVASSGLAGNTVPEMLDNLAASGIDHIELDRIQGRPVHVLPADHLGATVAAFRDQSIDVTALRCGSLPEPLDEFLDRAAASGVNRVVLPLTDQARNHATLAEKRGLSLSLSNALQGSERTTEMLLGLVDAGADVTLSFSSGGFVRAGEKPFLQSFGRKLRRFIDQIDVEDVSRDGAAQPLARGNAEIKELVSALRCRSFDGRMVLTPTNREIGDLRSVADSFDALLDAM